MSDAVDTFRPRRHTQTLLAILVAGALVGGGTAINAGWHAWRDPHAFRGNDFPLAGVSGKFRPNHPMNIGMSYVDDTTARITVDSARPRVLLNTAHATITVSVCTIDPSQRIGAIASASGDLSKLCSKLVAADGARMQLRSDGLSDQLLVTIRPTRSGVVMVWGLDVTYGYGHRHGTQHVGENARLVFRTPAR